MYKKTITGIIVALFLAIPIGVYASNSNVSETKHHGKLSTKFNISKLNDQQKADLKAQMEKMIQLKKETVQKMVDNGSITKEQGDQMLQKLDERLKSIQEGKLDMGKGIKLEKGKKSNSNINGNKKTTNQEITASL